MSLVKYIDYVLWGSPPIALVRTLRGINELEVQSRSNGANGTSSKDTYVNGSRAVKFDTAEFWADKIAGFFKNIHVTDGGSKRWCEFSNITCK